MSYSVHHTVDRRLSLTRRCTQSRKTRSSTTSPGAGDRTTLGAISRNSKLNRRTPNNADFEKLPTPIAQAIGDDGCIPIKKVISDTPTPEVLNKIEQHKRHVRTDLTIA